MTAKKKIIYEDIKPLTEALKEGGRVVALAIIPVIIDGLNKGEVPWRVVGVVAAVTALRTLDKWLHLLGKEKGDDKLTRGLTQF